MTAKRSIGIVGLGHVGAHVAYSLLMQGIADELVLCDINTQKVISEDQDFRDAMAFCPRNTRIVDAADRYEELAGCDIVVNAAGKVELCAVTRDGELFFSTAACSEFVPRIAKAGFEGIWLSVANPCDVVATLTQQLSGCDPRRVIGSGTALDSARLRAALAKRTGYDAHSIEAYMIGEHGQHQTAVWSHVAFGGQPLERMAAQLPERFGFDRDVVEDEARQGAYVTFAGKRCTEYAVANTTARLCAAVLHDEHAILPCSTLLTGQYGQSGIYASLPCVIGRNGVEQVLELELAERERQGFADACDAIRANLARVQAGE